MDLLRADRDVAAAVAELRVAGVAMDWESHRHVAGQNALAELAEFTPSAIDLELRDALATWITWLTIERVSQPAARRLAEARESARALVHLERDERLGLRELVSGMLSARTAGEARAFFEGLPQIAEVIAAPCRELRAVRAEAMKRIASAGYSKAQMQGDVALRFLGIERDKLMSSARQFLVRTDDLARASRNSADPWPIDLDLRLARKAVEGWPARLTWRTGASLLPGLRDRRLTLRGEPAKALGAASFARVVAAIGEAFRRTTVSTSAPLSLREPPCFVDAVRTGLVFASITTSPAFHARVLGLGVGRAKDQARELAIAALLEARLSAARALMTTPNAFDFAELTTRLFGAPLPAIMNGAWPAANDDHLTRWLAFITVREHVDALVSREGDDWFRNPRAFATLSDMTRSSLEMHEGDAGELARRFEAMIG